jgi:pantoate kinase
MQSQVHTQAESISGSYPQYGEAYAPGHITGFFTIHLSEDPVYTGSRGAGICLEAGVTTRVTIRKSDKPEIVLLWNDMPLTDSRVSKSVMRRFFGPNVKLSVLVEQRSILPLNYGYGISGASALSLALAVNKALGSPLPRVKAGEIAHLAEVENLTGLGDVSAQMVGGFEMRLLPGAPTVGRVQRLQTPEDYLIITTPVKPVSTNKMISDHFANINEKGELAISSFMNSPTLDAFITLSRKFWESLWCLDPEIARVLKKYESIGIKLVSLKKGLVYGLIHKDEAGSTLERISPKSSQRTLPMLIYEPSVGLPIIVTRISSGGAC